MIDSRHSSHPLPVGRTRWRWIGDVCAVMQSSLEAPCTAMLRHHAVMCSDKNAGLINLMIACMTRTDSMCAGRGLQQPTPRLLTSETRYRQLNYQTPVCRMLANVVSNDRGRLEL